MRFARGLRRSATLAAAGGLLLALCANRSARGQTKLAPAPPPSVPEYRLSVGRGTPLNSAAIPNFGAVKCDSRGNVYLRLLLQNFVSFYTPVTEFSRDGSRRAAFSLSAAPRWVPGDIMDYAIGPNGRVYLLVDHLNKQRKTEDGILVFGQDGDLRSTIRLQLGTPDVDRIGVFSTGDFLVLATKRAKQAQPLIPGTPVHGKITAEHRAPVNPVAYLVGHDGRLLKTILPPEGLVLTRDHHAGPPLEISATSGDTAQLVMSEYGHTAYLMFEKGVPVVYAISSSGDVLRSFPIELPSGGFTPIMMTWANGLGLLLESAHVVNHGFPASQVRFSVINPQTGERLDDYRVGPRLGTDLACFSRQHITFLTSPKGKLTLTDATIH